MAVYWCCAQAGRSLNRAGRLVMKVFVTGATGFVGEVIVQQLHQAGHSARALLRNKGLNETRKLTGSEIHVGNILDTESLRGALQGIDAVIHLVGIISEVGESTFEN